MKLLKNMLLGTLLGVSSHAFGAHVGVPGGFDVTRTSEDLKKCTSSS